MTTDQIVECGCAQRLQEALGRALRADPAALMPLTYARTTVAFRLTASGETLTLRLDETPPRVQRGPTDAEAEIEIELSEQQANAFADGRVALTVAVSCGDVAARGPVRKYLEVDPIIRGLLARADGGRPAAKRETTNGAPVEQRPPIDPDLLAIQTLGLAKSFGNQRVLAGLDLGLPEGTIAVVLGPSGTGKSVLLQHIIGLMKPDAGHVVVRGRNVVGMGRDELITLRREIGVMFQDGALLSTMSVYDNTAFPLRQHTDLREPEIREVVMERLGTVGLTDAADRMPNELSGGMRKRAGLARALVMDPGILLCDEPDSGLDPVRTALLADLLLEEHERIGGTTVVVTHNVKLARYICDHISIIWKGGVVVSGFADDVLGSEDPFVKQFLAGETLGPLQMD